MAHNITLTIITQEKELLKEEVSQVTVPTTTGEITVLPNHIPLFTQLQVGELTYKKDGKSITVVISGGFMDVAPNNTITVLTDSAIEERNISVAKAEEAKKKAEEDMSQKLDKRKFLMAEASLRRAMLELKVAKKHAGKHMLTMQQE